MDLNMTIPEKINCLETCLNKAENVEYSVQVKWGNNQDETRREIRVAIENARQLFERGRIDQLDYDVRQEAYNKWHNILNAHLRKFPEYYNTQDKSTGLGM